MIPTKLSVGHRSAEPYNRLDYMTKIIYIKKAIRSYNTLAYNFLKKDLFLFVWVGFSDKKCALRENRSAL